MMHKKYIAGVVFKSDKNGKVQYLKNLELKSNYTECLDEKISTAIKFSSELEAFKFAHTIKSLAWPWDDDLLAAVVMNERGNILNKYKKYK